MPTIVHLDIASDNPQRARAFYESLFGWKFESPPGMDDYYLFDTTDEDGNVSVGGGLGLRGDPTQKITAYIGVDDIDAYGKNVEKLGGKVVSPKMPVPGWGYLSVCTDTEGNPFGLWQDDKSVGF